MSVVDFVVVVVVVVLLRDFISIIYKINVVVNTYTYTCI